MKYKAIVPLFLLTLFSAAAAALEVAELEGSPVSSMQQLQGKVVLVDFWASWCAPCRKSFPWLNSLQQRHAADGFLVLAVNEDSERTEAARFLQHVPAEFSVLYDQAGAIAEKYQLMGMPSSLLIDRKGQIRYRHVGFKQADITEYEAKIRQLLAEE